MFTNVNKIENFVFIGNLIVTVNFLFYDLITIVIFFYGIQLIYFLILEFDTYLANVLVFDRCAIKFFDLSLIIRNIS